MTAIAEISAEAIVNNSDRIDIKYLIKEAHKIALKGGRVTESKNKKTIMDFLHESGDR
ncbi:hypothetical protein [Pleurocapsa sp. FMAR1]|uniref:hypothetical protein n=1 Tax=Pleurocapsa sp. FMAR1 TaxID=3040204 RepID=UPI0029C8A578|nr:hypothetical protein [Pleurocapsa sp. FMAR1]